MITLTPFEFIRLLKECQDTIHQLWNVQQVMR